MAESDARPSAPDAGGEPLEAARSGWWRRWLNVLGPMLGLLLVFGLFAALKPDTFLSWRNAQTLAIQMVIVGLAALGATAIMIMGGIDLTVGSMIALCTVVVAQLLNVRSGSGALLLQEHPVVWPLLAAAGGVFSCALCGLVNGSLITGLSGLVSGGAGPSGSARVMPFVVTLGMMLVVRGAAKGLADEKTVAAPAGNWLLKLAERPAAETPWMLVAPAVWLMLLCALLMAGLLLGTRAGRRIFAVGSNEQTARLCGVRVVRVKLFVYALGGAMAGLAGVVQFSRLTVGDPTVAFGLELDVIAAVVIGGGSLAGGEGSILGCLMGAMLLEVIRSGCNQLDLKAWVHQIITGGIIILAAFLDRLRRRGASG